VGTTCAKKPRDILTASLNQPRTEAFEKEHDMTGIGRRAAAIGAVTALLAGVGVGAANAATTHHQSPSTATAKAKRHAKTSSSSSAKARRDEGDSQAMKLREQRGPGSPREERNESKALQRKELRNHAEVRSTATASHKAGTTQKKH
jgi:hypothetical protein